MKFRRPGDFGSDPYAIGSYFADHAVPFVPFSDYRAMAQDIAGNMDISKRSAAKTVGIAEAAGHAAVYIVSFWNGDSIFCGLHTVAFYASAQDVKLHVLNLHADSRVEVREPDLASFVNRRRFIVGYRIAPFHECGEIPCQTRPSAGTP